MRYCRQCERAAVIRFVPNDVLVSAECQRRCLGFDLGDCICPAENGTIAEDMVLSARQRYARRAIDVDPRLLKRLGHFNQLLMRAVLKPLAITLDTSISAWVADTSYSEAEIRDLVKAFLWQFKHITAKDCNVNSFKKRERLPGDFNEYIDSLGDEDVNDLKFGRSINARKDWFKVFSGPIFHLIEHEVFKLIDREFGFCPFIKYVPVPDRTAWIVDHLDYSQFYMETDHSAFEAHTTRDIMRQVELPLYRYMTKNLPYGHVWFSIVSWVMTKSVWSVYKGKVKIKTEPMRYSGEMCTSLGNGWTNYVLMKFVMRVHNIVGRGFVEGDDGIFAVSSPVDPNWFRECGFNVKLEIKQRLGLCGFCSLNFGPNGQNVREPREVLAGFGWSFSDCRHGGRKVLSGLLRAKAFSLAYEMPNCPILSSFAAMVLRSTVGFQLRWDKHDIKYKQQQVYQLFKQGKLDQVEKRLSRVITQDQRLFVSEIYRIPVSDQLLLEQYFDSVNTVQTLKHPVLDKIFPNLWSVYGHRYSYVVYANVQWNVVQLMQRI